MTREVAGAGRGLGRRAGLTRRGFARRAGVASTAALATLLAPALALAHPLGNFTINHFAVVRVAPDRISLDVVIDRAEIPAFQEVRRLDTDGDGSLSGTELAGQAEAGCLALAPDLRLALNGAAVAPTLVAAGLSTPPGAGGLPTMRLVCQLEAALPAAIGEAATVAFEDRSFAERIGWREILVLGDGLVVDGRPSNAAAGDGVSARLTQYPDDLLAQPLDVRSVTVEVGPGGVDLPAWAAPDAAPVGAAAPDGGGVGSGAPGGGAVPGGVTEDIAALVDATDLTPIALIVSLAIAFALGIVHALTPGHGKTIMAAYLIGSGGSSRQAVGLGLAVAISHTLGVLALAGISLAASAVLPPERLYPVLGVVSGGLVIAIGAALLWRRLQAVLAARAHARTHEHGDAHGHSHGHADGHSHSHGHGHSHSHGPGPDHATVSWRGMLALGLSGGLVPSTSALILLLGSIAAGRVAYGLVLVLGFGLGMAVVLTGIGLLLVHARRLVERRPTLGTLRRLGLPIQLGAASLVVILGIVLTGQALTQVL